MAIVPYFIFLVPRPTGVSRRPCSLFLFLLYIYSNLCLAKRNCNSNTILFRGTSFYRNAQIVEVDHCAGNCICHSVWSKHVFLWQVGHSRYPISHPVNRVGGLDREISK